MISYYKNLRYLHFELKITEISCCNGIAKPQNYDIQKKFKFALPNIKGFEFHDEPLNGFHIIVGKKTGSSPKKAVVYFPGGGSRRWQMPSNGSIKKYIGLRDKNRTEYVPCMACIYIY